MDKQQTNPLKDFFKQFKSKADYTVPAAQRDLSTKKKRMILLSDPQNHPIPHSHFFVLFL